MDWCQGELVVSVWVRLAMDQAGRAGDLITSEALGVDGILRDVAGALNDFDPVDGDGDYILKASLSFVSAANRGFSGKSKAEGWFRVETRWACAFDYDLATGGVILWPDGSAVYWPDGTGARWPT